MFGATPTKLCFFESECKGPSEIFLLVNEGRDSDLSNLVSYGVDFKNAWILLSYTFFGVLRAVNWITFLDFESTSKGFMDVIN